MQVVFVAEKSSWKVAERKQVGRHERSLKDRSESPSSVYSYLLYFCLESKSRKPLELRTSALVLLDGASVVLAIFTLGDFSGW